MSSPLKLSESFLFVLLPLRERTLTAQTILTMEVPQTPEDEEEEEEEDRRPVPVMSSSYDFDSCSSHADNAWWEKEGRRQDDGGRGNIWISARESQKLWPMRVLPHWNLRAGHRQDAFTPVTSGQVPRSPSLTCTLQTAWHHSGLKRQGRRIHLNLNQDRFRYQSSKHPTCAGDYLWTTLWGVEGTLHYVS